MFRGLIPFDLKHFFHIVYGNGLVELRAQLAKRVQWVVDNPPSNNETGLKEDVEVFVKDKNLANGPAEYECDLQKFSPHIEICLHNISSRTIETGSLKVGFIMEDDEDVHVRAQGFKSITLPDSRKLHLYQEIPTLLPDEYQKVTIVFDGRGDFKTLVRSQSLKVVLRLFTSKGSRDFDISLKAID